MADTVYSLSFAEVPFLNDDSRTYQFSRPGGEKEGRSPVRKQQAQGWLWEEIQRRLPTDYLTDMGQEYNYPGRNTGSLARLIRGNRLPGPQVRLGDYYYPTGACRYSYFRGVATSTQAKGMLAATQGNRPQTFSIKAAMPSGAREGISYGIETNLYMLPPRPLGETAGTFDGLYLITLVDERYYWQYNPITLNRAGQHLPDNISSWDELIEQIATALQVTINHETLAGVYAEYGPEPDSHLWNNDEDVALLLDAIAANTGRVVVRGYDGTYELMTPYDSVEQARNNREGSQGKVLRWAGGDVFYSGTDLPVGSLQKSRNAAPTAVRLTFPRWVAPAGTTPPCPIPHFAWARENWSEWYTDSYNATFSIDIPVTSGGRSGGEPSSQWPLSGGVPGTSVFSGISGGPAILGVDGYQVSGNNIHTIFDTVKAVYNSQQDASGVPGVVLPRNYSGLFGLATKVAEDYYYQNWVDGLDECYYGIVNWQPEGVHDLLFSWSARWNKACTRVMRSEYGAVVRDMQHRNPDSENITAAPGVVISPYDFTISNYGVSGNELNLDTDIVFQNCTQPDGTSDITLLPNVTVNWYGDSTTYLNFNVGNITFTSVNMTFNVTNLTMTVETFNLDIGTLNLTIDVLNFNFTTFNFTNNYTINYYPYVVGNTYYGIYYVGNNYFGNCSTFYNYYGDCNAFYNVYGYCDLFFYDSVPFQSQYYPVYHHYRTGYYFYYGYPGTEIYWSYTSVHVTPYRDIFCTTWPYTWDFADGGCVDFNGHVSVCGTWDWCASDARVSGANVNMGIMSGNAPSPTKPVMRMFSAGVASGIIYSLGTPSVTACPGEHPAKLTIANPSRDTALTFQPGPTILNTEEVVIPPGGIGEAWYDPDALGWRLGGGGSCKVKVSADDECCDYLLNKLSSVSGTIEISKRGPTEEYECSVANLDTIGYTGDIPIVVSVICSGGSLTVDTGTLGVVRGLIQTYTPP